MTMPPIPPAPSPSAIYRAPDAIAYVPLPLTGTDSITVTFASLGNHRAVALAFTSFTSPPYLVSYAYGASVSQLTLTGGTSNPGDLIAVYADAKVTQVTDTKANPYAIELPKVY
jgi:hypothetical protein